MYPVFTEYGCLFVLLQERESETGRYLIGRMEQVDQQALHVTDREERREGDCHRLANRQANDR